LLKLEGIVGKSKGSVDWIGVYAGSVTIVVVIIFRLIHEANQTKEKSKVYVIFFIVVSKKE
jgi:hypothetical protein